VIKQVFIPIVELGKQKGDILELYIQSRWFKPRSCFSELQGTELLTGIKLAKTALDNLQQSSGSGMIYTVNSKHPLSNAYGTSAGLAMAYLMTLKQCYQQRLIVSAGLEVSESKPSLLKYTGFWQKKLAAILALEAYTEITPLILAKETPLTSAQIEVLLRHNIQPYLLDNLAEATEFCLHNTYAKPMLL
jgi:hypothetical protein